MSHAGRRQAPSAELDPAGRRPGRPLPPGRPAQRERERAVLARARPDARPARRRARHRRRRRAGRRACWPPPGGRRRCSTGGSCGCSTSTSATTSATSSTSGAPAPPSTSWSRARGRCGPAGPPGSCPRWPRSIAVAHDAGVAHGRLVPENVLDRPDGSVRVIGFSVDAALLGLPPGRLVVRRRPTWPALLYFLLTGRWPGRLALRRTRRAAGGRPRAAAAPGPRRGPAAAGRAVRPGHQPFAARAGAEATTSTARTPSARTLREFVGDAVRHGGGRGAAGRRNGSPGTETRLLPLTPGRHPRRPAPSRDARAGAGRAAKRRPRDGPRHPSRPAPTEQPTQAGLPIFDDETDDVSWLSARAETPPPPPPFEEPPERPLFAPDPADGRPVAQPRPGRRGRAAGVLALGRQHRHRLPGHDRQRRHPDRPRTSRGRRGARAAAGCGWPAWSAPARSCCSRSSSPSTSAAAHPAGRPARERARRRARRAAPAVRVADAAHRR